MLKKIAASFVFFMSVYAANPAYAGLPEVECGVSVAAAGTFGGCLDALDQKVRAMIESFENSGKALEVGLAGQVAMSIALARMQFGAEIDKQVATVNASARKFAFDTVAQLGKLEAKTFSDDKTLARDIHSTADAIPFARREPAVRPLENPYFIPSSTGALRLQIDGHFLDASQDGYRAHIRIDEKSEIYEQTGNTTDTLSFKMPFSALARTGAETNAVEYRHLTLTVPYLGNDWWCFLKFLCKHESKFSFDLVALPVNPGRLSLIVKSPSKSIVTNGVTSPEQFQDSKDNDITEDKNGKLYCFPPSNGWAIRPATVKGKVTQIVDKGEENTDWWWVANPDSASSAANACVRLETLHKSWGNSGKVKFVVTYTEEREESSVTQREEPSNLTWGENSVIPLSAGESLYGTFTQFDGRVYHFDGPGDLGTPFFTVEPTTTGVRISYVGNPM